MKSHLALPVCLTAPGGQSIAPIVFKGQAAGGRCGNPRAALPNFLCDFLSISQRSRYQDKPPGRQCRWYSFLPQRCRRDNSLAPRHAKNANRARRPPEAGRRGRCVWRSNGGPYLTSHLGRVVRLSDFLPNFEGSRYQGKPPRKQCRRLIRRNILICINAQFCAPAIINEACVQTQVVAAYVGGDHSHSPAGSGG